MSTRNLFRSGLTFLLLVCAIPVQGQQPDSRERITRGTCPGEFCRLGPWQATVALPVYAAPGAARPVFRLAPRIPFEAVSGETHSIPGALVLRGRLPVSSEGRASWLPSGETVRTLADLGEGWLRIEARGTAWNAQMSERDSSRFQILEPLRETWWVQIRTSDGQSGWIDGGSDQVAGGNYHETAASRAARVGDSSSIADLTGPVAGILKDGRAYRTSRFTPAIEGAEKAEGTAWSAAGLPRLLELRFNVPLSGTGTTDPRHSGLPPEEIVCCGNRAYRRFIVFEGSEPEYAATVTIPDRGKRRVVEAFFRDGRLARLVRDGRTVGVGYSDSVFGRGWYSEARDLRRATEVRQASRARAASAAQPVAKPTLLDRVGGVDRIYVVGGLAAVLMLGVGVWRWRRRSWTRPARGQERASKAVKLELGVPEPPPDEGWVCPYCHAEVLVERDTCWLCERPRPRQ